MPRVIWSGAISFGLVSVPVKLYPAVSRRTVRFNQLDGSTNSRVRQKRVNSEGEEVPHDRIVKGYEVAKDSYVVVTDDELAALAPEASRMIDISDFVAEAEIDPVFHDSAYYLVPEELARWSTPTRWWRPTRSQGSASWTASTPPTRSWPWPVS
jgi:DNA end-binding protein Ku